MMAHQYANLTEPVGVAVHSFSTLSDKLTSIASVATPTEAIYKAEEVLPVDWPSIVSVVNEAG